MIKMTDKEFIQLSTYIKSHSGINLKDEKRTLLVGRLNNQLTNLGFENFSSYHKYLIDDPQGKKLSDLLDKVTTNHTYFMRESEHFTYFSQEVLPYLKSQVKTRDLRVWCAASSSGEEPYTLAILLNEFFKKDFLTWDKKLLATDISMNILEKANKGIYTKEQVALLPKIWILNYFNKIDEDHFQVKESIRNEVIYRRFNLLEERYPFKKKFHVIFIRNVMIYFDGPTKDALIEKLYDQLEYGGYLFIGHSETITREKTRFKYIKPAVYRKV